MKTREDLFPPMPVYSFNGEELPLDQIVERKVTAVTIKYLSAQKRVKAPGLLGLLGKKIINQSPKELKVTDLDGIRIIFQHGQTVASIRFNDKGESDKLVDYDESIISKRFIMTIVKPQMISFHLKNLEAIEWK